MPQTGDTRPVIFAHAPAEIALPVTVPAERAFLWQQYARSRSSRANRPLWAEITVALAEQDKAASGQ